MYVMFYIFDNIAIPMWAVQELVQNDFANFFVKENLERKVICDGTSEKFTVDTEYYIRTTMKDIELSYDRINARYDTLKTNFLNKLGSNESILFIRCEEPSSYFDMGNLIIFPEHQAKYDNEKYNK